MLKNPFSFYDFLGYLFPGLVCVIFLKMIVSIDGAITIDSIFLHGLVSSFSWKDTVQYTVLAYVVGHLVSYFSSLTVEPYLIWSYGYPSVFLMKENYDKKFYEINHNVGPFGTYCWKTLVCILIFPICLASLFFGRLLHFKYYVLKPLDSYLQQNINKKIDSLLEKLKLEGKNAYFIPGGGHGNLGTKAYVEAYQEIKKYENKKNNNF